MENIEIFIRPLSDIEFKKHMMDGRILKTPNRYCLVDIFKCLKYGRPVESQKQLDQFIAFLELNNEANGPFHPDIVNATWNK